MFDPNSLLIQPHRPPDLDVKPAPLPEDDGLCGEPVHCGGTCCRPDGHDGDCECSAGPDCPA